MLPPLQKLTLLGGSPVHTGTLFGDDGLVAFPDLYATIMEHAANAPAPGTPPDNARTRAFCRMAERVMQLFGRVLDPPNQPVGTIPQNFMKVFAMRMGLPDAQTLQDTDVAGQRAFLKKYCTLAHNRDAATVAAELILDANGPLQQGPELVWLCENGAHQFRVLARYLRRPQLVQAEWTGLITAFGGTANVQFAALAGRQPNVHPNPLGAANEFERFYSRVIRPTVPPSTRVPAMLLLDATFAPSIDTTEARNLAAINLRGGQVQEGLHLIGVVVQQVNNGLYELHAAHSIVRDVSRGLARDLARPETSTTTVWDDILALEAAHLGYARQICIGALLGLRTSELVGPMLNRWDHLLSVANRNAMLLRFAGDRRVGGNSLGTEFANNAKFRAAVQALQPANIQMVIRIRLLNNATGTALLGIDRCWHLQKLRAVLDVFTFADGELHLLRAEELVGGARLFGNGSWNGRIPEDVFPEHVAMLQRLLLAIPQNFRTAMFDTWYAAGADEIIQRQFLIGCVPNLRVSQDQPVRRSDFYSVSEFNSILLAFRHANAGWYQSQDNTNMLDRVREYINQLSAARAGSTDPQVRDRLRPQLDYAIGLATVLDSHAPS